MATVCVYAVNADHCHLILHSFRSGPKKDANLVLLLIWMIGCDALWENNGVQLKGEGVGKGASLSVKYKK